MSGDVSGFDRLHKVGSTETLHLYLCLLAQDNEGSTVSKLVHIQGAQA